MIGVTLLLSVIALHPHSCRYDVYDSLGAPANQFLLHRDMSNFDSSSFNGSSIGLSPYVSEDELPASGK